jgi:hypothetical protein
VEYVVEREPVHISFGRPGFKPGTGRVYAVMNGLAETHTILHSLHRCQNWAGRLLVG